MRREWRPGDVAVLMTEKGERIGFRCGVSSNMGWQYASEPGQNTWTADRSGYYVTPVRPLVVIDPEDREAVERLCDLLFAKSGHPYVPAVQAALREFANPTPPKPDEPANRGAVVEDANGYPWTRFSKTEAENGGDWINEDGYRLPWADVPAVRVLSEGVAR